jgi:hypothetical protein
MNNKTQWYDKYQQYLDYLKDFEDFSKVKNIFDKNKYITAVMGDFDQAAIKSTKDEFFCEKLSLELYNDDISPALELAAIAEDYWKNGYIDELSDSYIQLDTNLLPHTTWLPVDHENVDNNYSLYRVDPDANREIMLLLRLRLARIIYHLDDIIKSEDLDFSDFISIYFLGELETVMMNSKRPAQFVDNKTNLVRSLFTLDTIESDTIAEIIARLLLGIYKDKKESTENLIDRAKSIASRLDLVIKCIERDSEVYGFAYQEINDAIIAFGQLLKQAEHGEEEIEDTEVELQNINNSLEEVQIFDAFAQKQIGCILETRAISISDQTSEAFLEEEKEIELLYKEKIKFIVDSLNDLVNDFVAQMECANEEFLSEFTKNSLTASAKMTIESALKSAEGQKIRKLNESLGALANSEYSLSLLWNQWSRRESPELTAAKFIYSLIYTSYEEMDMQNIESWIFLFKMLNMVEIAIAHYLKENTEFSYSLFKDVSIFTQKTESQWNPKLTSISTWSKAMLDQLREGDIQSHPGISLDFNKDGWQKRIAFLVEDDNYPEYFQLAQRFKSLFRKDVFAVESYSTSAINRIFDSGYADLALYSRFLRGVGLQELIINSPGWRVPVFFPIPLSTLPSYEWIEAYLAREIAIGAFVSDEDSPLSIHSLFPERTIYLYDSESNPLDVDVYPLGLIDPFNLGNTSVTEVDPIVYHRLNQINHIYDKFDGNGLVGSYPGWLINQCLIAEQRLKETQEVPGWLNLSKYLNNEGDLYPAQSNSISRIEEPKRVVADLLDVMIEKVMFALDDYLLEAEELEKHAEKIEIFLDYLLWAFGYSELVYPAIYNSASGSIEKDDEQILCRLDANDSFQFRLRELINLMIQSPALYFTSSQWIQLNSPWGDSENESVQDIISLLNDDSDTSDVIAYISLVTTNNYIGDALVALREKVNTILLIEDSYQSPQERVFNKALLLDILINFPGYVFFPYETIQQRPPVFHQIESIVNEYDIAEYQPMLPFCYLSPTKLEANPPEQMKINIVEATKETERSNVSAKNTTRESSNISQSSGINIQSKETKQDKSQVKGQNQTTARSRQQVREAVRLELKTKQREHEMVLVDQTEQQNQKLKEMQF